MNAPAFNLRTIVNEPMQIIKILLIREQSSHSLVLGNVVVYYHYYYVCICLSCNRFYWGM